jgi:hypothetical protein
MGAFQAAMPTLIWTTASQQPTRGIGKTSIPDNNGGLLERFWDLLAHSMPLTPKKKVQLFTTCLPECIKIDVKLMAPRDLNHALSLARAYERRAQALDIHQTSTTSKPSRPPQRPSFPIPAQQSTVTVEAPTSTGHTTSI